MKNYVQKEDDYEKRLHKALNKGDSKTLAYFSRFGVDVRKQIMNVRNYEQYLLCGYTGEPHFNQYGWLDNESELRQLIHDEPVFSKNYQWHINVLTLQHPNGKWVAGVRFFFGITGSSVTPGIWSTWHNSCEEAKRAVLNPLPEHLKDAKSPIAKTCLAAIHKAISETSVLQLTFDF